MTTDRRILYQGELQLMRWSESSTNGASVTFWVHPEDLESFKLLKARAGKQTGQRLACVLMEISEEEAIVTQPPAPSPSPSPPPRRYRAATLGDLGLLSVRWCKDERFQRWVANQIGEANERASEADCKAFILHESGITEKYDEPSRKHLDADEECAALFQKNIRLPFMDFNRGNE